MIKSPRFSSFAWLAAPLAAGGFLIWMNVVRIQHIEDVSAQGGGRGPPPAATALVASAPPEFAAGNGLIVPENLTASYHWIARTQRMFNRGEWRVRHIDYENAPFGRAVPAASPYRWWLGLLAWCDHVLTGRPAGQCVERAALVADPLLHGLLLLGATILVAWRFGAFPAALISTALVTMYPFAAEFLPGAPDDHGMALIFTLGSVGLLLAGISPGPAPDPSGKLTRRWFFLAGVTGGLGLWLDATGQVPIIAGVALGGLLAAWAARHPGTGEAPATDLPWRTWAVGGAVTTLGAYLLEFAPAHLGEWQLAAIHPLHGVAWLGGGELLAQAAGWVQGKKISRTRGNLALLALAVAAVAAAPVVLWKASDHAFLLPGLESFRLTRLPEGVVAPGLGAWLSRDGATGPVWATLLPLLLIAPAIGLAVRRSAGRAPRVSAALALGPVLIALGFARQQLAWWKVVDGLLLVLLVAVAGGPAGATGRRYGRLAWAGLLLLLLLPGAWQATPQARAGGKNGLTESEVIGLIERDLAGWLALRAEPTGAVILAPPDATTALCYYGGLRGLGTLSWENKEGVAAAVRILTASTPEEAKELIDRRGITHLVILSWDAYFDAYARGGTGRIEGTFRDQLHFSTLPPWLRPAAYPLPTIPGFEGRSVTIYEVVEDQPAATAAGRIAEYLVEMGDLDQAAAVAQALRRFPADPGAWVARAEVELARGDEAAFARSLALLQSRLAARTALVLPWDQRVSLAVILAKAKQPQLSREQAMICLAAADGKKLRALSTGSLYRLLVLSRAFDLTWDPSLRQLALDLLPGDLRERVK